MVCTFGRGRMSCIARLLEAGSFPEKSADRWISIPSQTVYCLEEQPDALLNPFPESCSELDDLKILPYLSCFLAEEATHERIAIQTIYRQFCDADEPNLLEEKDMHVFDSRPLRDPLHLVCCNDCGKPVKASQFAAHADRCRSINSKEDAALELDTGTGRKKPLKKGRRIQTTNGMTTPIGRGAVPDSSAVYNGVSGMPGPLATKIYHVQGSHRLRIALGHLYQQTSVREHGNDSVFVQHHQDNALSSRVLYGNQSLHEIHGENVSQTKF